MTATRTTRFWAMAVGIGLWVVGAFLLWRTSVPGDLRLPQVEARDAFDARHLERSARYERGLRLLWLGALLAELTMLVFAAWLAPRSRARGILGGVALGAATLVAVWLVRLPFVVATHWWRRRYGVS